MKASCSVRVVRPFLRLASAREDYRDLVPEACWSANTDARVSLDATEAMLERAFGGSRLRFGAPFLGLVFDRADAKAPMPAADPIIHRAI